MQYTLEVCVDSVESALTAQENGATRLELCGHLVLGGVTPTVALYHQVKKRTSLPLHVLIRPRYGDFLYSDYEFSVLMEEVLRYVKLGADGIVTGCLNADGTLDMERMKRIVAAAQKGRTKVILSRAFDLCADPLEALEQAVELGIDTILTSGQQENCLDGEALLHTLNQKAAGRIRILIGGGVNAGVVEELSTSLKMKNFHMSGKILERSDMVFRRDLHMGSPLLNEYELVRVDPYRIYAAAKVLKKHFGKDGSL